MPTYTGFKKKSPGATSVSERELARLFYMAGDTGHVQTRQSFTVTPIGGQRRVSISMGGLSACGVLVQRSQAADVVTIDIPTPGVGKGQWHLVIARFDWDAGAVSYLTIPSELTGQGAPDSMPARPPRLYPDLNRDAGVLFDVPLAWVWASYGFTALRYVNLGIMPDGVPAGVYAWDGVGKASRSQQDDIGPGESGEFIKLRLDFMDRGLYRINAVAIKKTTISGTTSLGEVVLVVNGEEVVKMNAHTTAQAQPVTFSAEIDHPGGTLEAALSLRGVNANVGQLPGSSLSWRWIRQLPPNGALA